MPTRMGASGLGILAPRRVQRECECRFLADSRLVWANALLYNGSESAIGRQAVAARRRFEESWNEEFGHEFGPNVRLSCCECDAPHSSDAPLAGRFASTGWRRSCGARASLHWSSAKAESRRRVQAQATCEHSNFDKDREAGSTANVKEKAACEASL